jgi:hypothetical protein
MLPRGFSNKKVIPKSSQEDFEIEKLFRKAPRRILR